MSQHARALGFLGIAGALCLVLLRSAPAESKEIFDSDGGRIGTLNDGTDPDGGGTPIVLPAPRQPTLEDLVKRASHCAVGKDGAYLILFQLDFRPDGRVDTLEFSYPPGGAACVRAVLEHARVTPFTGPHRRVSGIVHLH